MFNYAIFRKTFKDSLISLVISCLGLVAFVVLFMWAMLNMGDLLLEFLSKAPFIIRQFVEMGFGFEVTEDVSMSTMFAVSFTHGVVLMLCWTVIIATSTRVTVGEIERGTADMLLTLPVRRSEVYLSTSLVWILAAALLSFCPVIGIWVGTLVLDSEEQIQVSTYVRPAVNFLCLNLAVGGLSSLVGSILNRRSVAIGVVVGITAVSIVINFLEPLLPQIRKINFLGLIGYFRPVEVVRNGTWPIASMAVLLTIGFVGWLVGLIIYCRKDIPTA